MSVKIIALGLISAAAFGTVAVPTMWHVLPHTTLPDSAEVMDCAIRQTPAGKDTDEVLAAR